MCDLRPSFNTVIRNITLRIAGTIGASTPNSSPGHCLQRGPARRAGGGPTKLRTWLKPEDGEAKREAAEGIWTTALTTKGLAKTQHPGKHFRSKRAAAKHHLKAWEMP